MAEDQRVVLMRCTVQLVRQEDGTLIWWADAYHGDDMVFYRRSRSYGDIGPHLDVLMGQAEWHARGEETA